MQNKELNRFVVEVQGGVVLFFNQATTAADGLWWGSDEDPLQHGPFASSEEALASACRGVENFKLERWDKAELRDGPDHYDPYGHIIVVDTGGRLWVKIERPAC